MPDPAVSRSNRDVAPGTNTPPSPLKIFDAARAADRFVYTSAPMVRYSKVSSTLGSWMLRSWRLRRGAAGVPADSARVWRRPLMDAHDPIQGVQPEPDSS